MSTVSVRELDDKIDLKARFRVGLNLEALNELVSRVKQEHAYENENEAIEALYEEITDNYNSIFSVELGEFADHDYLDL